MILSTLQCCSDHKTFSFFHRVDSTECRGAFSPVVRIGSPPAPSPQCCPPPFGSGGGGGHARGREDVGSQFGRRDRHSGTLGIVHPSPAFFISLKSSCNNVYNQHIFKVHHLSIQQIFAALPTCMYCPLCTVCTVWWLHCCEDKYLYI